jgi:ATP-dependent RNA helicase HrpB
MALTALPIDPLLPEIVASLRQNPSLVLEAPPGAGKTTRVPPALLDVVDGEILVLEPRRLAARLAARRVAEELGGKVGGLVGYRVRFEDVTQRSTRIVFVTEGVLLRRLASDPSLAGVGAVLLDEFHERHLHGDLGLALARRLQRTRPQLRIAAMSATLEADPVAAYLGGCPILRAEGRRFEVTVEHAARVSEKPLESDVAQAVRQLLVTEPDGDILVFLPGAAEIRRAQAALSSLPNADVVMLHGDLAPEEQDRAIRPGARRKVILSTNVAETSVTIEGVVAVVDSGLHRLASHSPWSGLPTLKVAKISRASATQRAGRAGRLRPGRCLRLYTKHDFDLRPAHDPPEVARVDLTETVLLLGALGVGDLDWFEPPNAAALDAARALLVRLGALDAGGAVTALGRRMLELPVHPRQARLLVEAEARGVADDAAVVAALVGERELTRKKEKVAGPSDLLADLDRFRVAERVRLHPDRLRGLGLDVGAALAVDRLRKQLRAALRPARRMPDSPEADAAIGLCVLAGYPDRVARRRQPGGRELVLSSGGTATLSPDSVVQSEWMVAVDAEERSGVMVRAASAIEPDWLIELYADRLHESRTCVWGAGRVEVVEKLAYDQLTLDEKRGPAPPSDEASRVLCEAARTRVRFEDGTLERIAFARAQLPDAGLPALDADTALARLCEGRTRLDELAEEQLLDLLDGKQRRELAELAPPRVTLPGGRSVKVHYPAGQPPFIESRLQDFFGMARGPTVGRGRVPLTLHLLAPNQRAVQVTSDLAGFWERHYPAIRRELGRKYPRHAWPDNPLTARPPEPRKR